MTQKIPKSRQYDYAAITKQMDEMGLISDYMPQDRVVDTFHGRTNRDHTHKKNVAWRKQLEQLRRSYSRRDVARGTR